MDEHKYRHEFKYPISDLEATVLQERLKAIIPIDKHVGETGKYTITSLYFDDKWDSCFYENENGSDPREKFRIRIYNHSNERISLECKRKERGKTLKTACLITEEQTKALMRGNVLNMSEKENPLLMKFTDLIMRKGYEPKVIVEYERIPFVYQNGNVRITLDSRLTSSYYTDRFLENDYLKRPVMPIGTQLLEVKYDEFLPDFIYRIMQLGDLTQTAFSKYYLCRKYNTF